MGDDKSENKQAIDQHNFYELLRGVESNVADH